MEQTVQRLLKVSPLKFAALFVMVAVLFSIMIVLTIDYLWDGRFNLELEFAGVITPFIDALLLVILITAMLGAIRVEVERRKSAEEEVRKLNEGLELTRQMLEEITHGITESILLLSKDYKILWANKTALAQSGLTMPELVGRPCHEISHRLKSPCESHNAPCPLPELLQSGTARMVEHTHHDKDRNPIAVEVSVYPVRNAKGEIDKIVHISKDVTERKRMEEEREKLITELQEALQRVKTLSGLLPICASCKKIRDDKGYWNQIEGYIQDHSEAMFTNGICPECTKKYFPEITKP